MSDISKITLPSGDIYNFKDIQARQAIPYGVVDSTSTSKVFTATIPGITSYVDGTTVMLKNGIVTSASGFTININGLGAKPVYNNMAAASAETTIFNVNYTMMFVYDSTRVSGGAWICYRGYDSNTNTIGYQLRTNSSVLKTYDKCRYYRLFFTAADGSHWVPANNGTDNSATSAKTVNQRPIDPFGKIVYCSANTNYAAEADIAATTIWEQYAFTLGYSFNRTGAALTLTTKAPVYIKCAPQTGGGAIIDSTTPYVQSLPSSKDGKIYVFLGIAYSETAVELWATHPVYWHDGTGIRLWTGSETAKIDVDSALSSTSENPVQNKVINSALASKADSSALSSYLPKSGGEMSGDITYSGGSFTIGNTFGHIILTETSGSSSTAIGLDADTVTAPTPTAGTNNTEVATTAFVNSALPSAATATPENLGTAAVGTSAKYAREDHVHAKPTYSKSDVGLGNVDNVQQYSASNPPPYPVTSVNGSTGAVTLSIPSKTSDLTNDSGYITSSSVPSAATATPIVDGTAAVGTSAKYAREDHVHPKATYTASEVGALPDTTTIPSKTSDLTNDSGFITGMYIGSYGTSTYAEILAAYQANKVVYCRASSNANPATGSQNRMAFLAYVNDQTTPTTFEFQYYRSVSSHSDSQQGDQVYIYTLYSTGTWGVTTREAYTKMVPSTGLSKSYNNGALTFSVSNPLPSVSASDNGKVLTVSNGAWAAASGSSEDKDAYRIRYQNNDYGTIKAKTNLYGYNILFTAYDGTLISSAQSFSTATNKLLTTNSFDPFGPIYFYNNSSTVSYNNYVSGEYLDSFGLAQSQYAFNIVANSLTKGLPVYLKCSMSSSGATLRSITQKLPIYEDGYVYIRLGIACSDSQDTTATNFYLTMSHPVYEYKNSNIRQYIMEASHKGANVLQLEIQDWGNEYVLLDGNNLYSNRYFYTDWDAIDIWTNDSTVSSEFNNVEHRRYYLCDYSELTTSTCIYKSLSGQNNIVIDDATEASSLTIEGHTFTIDDHYDSWTCPHN